MENAAFHGLAYLFYLSLRNNKLTVLDWKLFEKNIKLNDLYVADNPFISIDGNKGSILNIKVLNIYNTSLKDISKISDLPRLKTLNMGDNPQIKYYTTSFSNNLEMKVLYLTNTSLEKIENFNFLKNMKMLEYLNVMENNLENKIENLPTLPKLARLVLRKCDLKTFNYQQIKKKFPNLSRINLTENKFGCMFLHDMLKFLASYNISLDFTYSKHIHGAKSINNVQCNNSAVVNFEYLKKQIQQLEKELANAHHSIVNCKVLENQNQQLEKELNITNISLTDFEDIKTKNEQLTQELSFANDIKVVALATAFAIFTLTCIFIVLMLSLGKKPNQPNEVTKKNNDAPQTDDETAPPVTVRIPDTESIYETIAGNIYERLTWSRGGNSN
jgi:hypothetical protein